MVLIKVFHDHLFRNNEVIRGDAYTQPVEIENLLLQQEEVAEVRWFDLDEV